MRISRFHCLILAVCLFALEATPALAQNWTRNSDGSYTANRSGYVTFSRPGDYAIGRDNGGTNFRIPTNPGPTAATREYIRRGDTLRIDRPSLRR
jgi:hypothetical protein